ncbi:MAG: c-type cytochrome [Burkholderiales bacterium]
MRMISAAVFAAAALVFLCENAQAQVDAKKAQALATTAGCTACHQIDKKGVGPAYKEVAKKYKGNAGAAVALAERARKGGQGVWGPIPMPPNPPDKIGDADLRSVIDWVLSL